MPIIESNQLVSKIESKVQSLTVYIDIQLNVVHRYTIECCTPPGCVHDCTKGVVYCCVAESDNYSVADLRV